MSNNTPINQLDYVSYSIPDIIQAIDNILLQTNVFIDVLPSSSGQILVSWLASVTNVLLYYIERTAEEMYIQTAQKDSSVLNLVSILGYIPYRNVSATGSMNFTLSAPSLVNIYLPAKTVIQSIGGYYYSIAQSSVILAGVTTIAVPVVQGQWFSNVYTSTGNANQTYLINNTQIENSNLTITVNGVIWTPVSTFVGVVPSSQVYKLISNIDGTLTIEFGNGVFGKIPTTGQSIVVSYLQSDGANGNIFGPGVTLKLISTISDANSNPVTNLMVTNSAAIIGGANSETTDQVRINAPQVFATGQRAITKSDFKAILNNYPGVETSNVWGENDLSSPNYSAFNTIFISTVLQNWQSPTTAFNTILGQYLYNYSSITVKYSFTAPQIVQVMPYISIYALAGQSLSAIQSSVNGAFQNAFLLGITSILGQNIRYADVISQINAVSGVDYIYLTLAVYLPLVASGSNWISTAPLLNITASTVKLYTSTGLLIAQDNGVGGWTSVKSGYSISGSVNYTTGAITSTISPTQASAPYITYQQNQNGDLVVGLNQILQYFSMNTQVLTYG